MATSRARKPHIKPVTNLYARKVNGMTVWRQHVDTPQELLGIAIDGLPPTTNEVYRFTKTGIMYMNTKGKNYKKGFITRLKRMGVAIQPNTALYLTIVYWCKEGVSYQEAQINNFDVDGRHKILIDALFDAATDGEKSEEINDKWVWEVSLKKRLMTNAEAIEGINQKYPDGYTVLIVRTMSEDEL